MTLGPHEGPDQAAVVHGSAETEEQCVVVRAYVVVRQCVLLGRACAGHAHLYRTAGKRLPWALHGDLLDGSA